MQRPAAEVDDDPDEREMVPDPDLVRGQRSARCGGHDPGGSEEEHRNEGDSPHTGG
jgi:hypothetical protein